MRKNYFLSAALVAVTTLGLVGCSDNPDRITNVNEIVRELVDFSGFCFNDVNNNGSVDALEGLQGVRVTLFDPIQSKEIYAETDANGYYRFTSGLQEGSYNVKFTDTLGTVSGAVVNSVEYYYGEHVVNIVQPGNQADGTPERGSLAANFSMIDEPVIVYTNMGSLAPGVNLDISDFSGKEITFTFNKPVTVVNDPKLTDTTLVPNQRIALKKGASASIKMATEQGTTGYTAVSYLLPTLATKHQFSFVWLTTDYKATDGVKAFGPSIANQAPQVFNPQAAGAGNAATAAIPATMFANNTALNNTILLNTGSQEDIVTATNRAVITSVIAAAGSLVNTGAYVPTAGKIAIFAPQADCYTANRSGGAGGDVINRGLFTKAFDIQITNVKSELDYIPVVSYDGGTVWYFAADDWFAGNTANAGIASVALTLTTGNIACLQNSVPRPYFLVKGFYNSAAEGVNYTQLKVAMRTASPSLQVGNVNNAGIGMMVGATGKTIDAVAGYTTNGIDTNTERKADTYVGLFDGNLTNYKDKGFNRISQTAALTNGYNGLPRPERAEYQGSSYPYPLLGTAATGLTRANWFAQVQDFSILTDLVNPDGNIHNNAVASGSAVGIATLRHCLAGHEESASATVNVNDNPNPVLGSLREKIIYVYFNEPMDKTTIENYTTNWRCVTTVVAAAPSVSSVSYTESINTANGKEVFRAKVTLSTALVTGQRLEVRQSAMKDKNGNYPVALDAGSLTGYLEVFNY